MSVCEDQEIGSKSVAHDTIFNMRCSITVLFIVTLLARKNLHKRSLHLHLNSELI
jgi:hypothetical protein